MKKSYMAILFIIFLAGCGYGGNKDQANENGNGLTPVNYRKGENVNQDMITDQNPNFLNLKGTDENSSTNNQGFEMNKVRDVIERNQDYNAGRIWINGQDMYITVYPEDHLSNNRKRDARKELRKELINALPSYNIHLKVGNQ